MDKSPLAALGSAASRLIANWRGLLDVGSNLAIVIVAIALLWTMFPKSRPSAAAFPTELPPPAELQPLDGAAIKGSLSAPVGVIEYSEFQCPFCATFVRDTLPVLDRDYITPGRVLFAFRHFPLAGHPFAKRAATAADCAGQQGRFWEMHDLLFTNQPSLSEPTLQSIRETLRLDGPRFDGCLQGPVIERVENDVKHGRSLRVSGTPTFLFGRVENGSVRITARLSGAQPVFRFREILDRILAER